MQQTAQYIVELEQEKTQLLSQNCQLKRLVDQQDVGSATGGGVTDVHMLKKRKLTDHVYQHTTVSAVAAVAHHQHTTDSSDEGTGSMSPEPVSLLTATATGKTTTTTAASAAAASAAAAAATAVASKEIVELKHMLDVERRQKAALEERLRQIEIQIFPDRSRELQQQQQQLQQQHQLHQQQQSTTAAATLTYQQVIEHTDNVLRDDDDNDIVDDDDEQEPESANAATSTTASSNTKKMLQLVDDGSASLPPHAQIVVCTHADDDLVDEDSRPQSQCGDDGGDESHVIEHDDMNEDDLDLEHAIKEEYIMPELSRSGSPIETILSTMIVRQPILEAAIKAEPKVEVERINTSLPATLTVLKDEGAGGANLPTKCPSGGITITTTAKKLIGRQQRMYITTTSHNTSRQNLETIVEAIRHLEGDQLFGEMSSGATVVATTTTPAASATTTVLSTKTSTTSTTTTNEQDAPLALTNKPQRQLQIEMNPFLQFHPAATIATTMPAATSQQQQQPQTIMVTNPTIVSVVTQPQLVAASTVSHVQQQQQCRPGVIVVKQTS